MNQNEDGQPSPEAREEGRYFIAVMPTGWWWIDKKRFIDDDYVAVAFLNFSRLELEIFDTCPENYIEQVREKASEYQSLKGQEYTISGSGQKIRLGYALE